eukprot:gnl/TRDRNA2_/TRDRNA2_93465_c0_seq1.p1 gnl/TRDRNA2_/TRDRNA2_93465_c0~~gnl/TRDRNA2_/TRDRNA2_93465_c0_seq1.p1  ORF type:complete len:378 (+),score=92.88 gnl/TRDRNA2_/TRDRNA2_93465_c0_seq1:64-1197(+)
MAKSAADTKVEEEPVKSSRRRRGGRGRARGDGEWQPRQSDVQADKSPRPSTPPRQKAASGVTSTPRKATQGEAPFTPTSRRGGRNRGTPASTPQKEEAVDFNSGARSSRGRPQNMKENLKENLTLQDKLPSTAVTVSDLEERLRAEAAVAAAQAAKVEAEQVQSRAAKAFEAARQRAAETTASASMVEEYKKLVAVDRFQAAVHEAKLRAQWQETAREVAEAAAQREEEERLARKAEMEARKAAEETDIVLRAVKAVEDAKRRAEQEKKGPVPLAVYEALTASEMSLPMDMPLDPYVLHMPLMTYGAPAAFQVMPDTPMAPADIDEAAPLEAASVPLALPTPACATEPAAATSEQVATKAPHLCGCLEGIGLLLKAK